MRSHSRKRVAICGVSVDIPHCARNRWGDSALMESLGQAHSRRTQGVRLGAGRASKARRAGGTPLPQYQSVTIRSVTCKVSLFGSVEEHELLWPESYRTLLEDGTASYKSIAHRSRANFFRGKSRACGGLLRSGPVSGPASRARSSARAIRSLPPSSLIARGGLGFKLSVSYSSVRVAPPWWLRFLFLRLV